MLIGTYKLLIGHWRRWKITRTYWFSWDDDPNGCFYCTHSGLFTVDGTPKPAWYGFVKISHGQP